MSDNLVISIRW